MLQLALRVAHQRLVLPGPVGRLRRAQRLLGLAGREGAQGDYRPRGRQRQRLTRQQRLFAVTGDDDEARFRGFKNQRRAGGKGEFHFVRTAEEARGEGAAARLGGGVTDLPVLHQQPELRRLAALQRHRTAEQGNQRRPVGEADGAESGSDDDPPALAADLEARRRQRRGQHFGRRRFPSLV